MLRQLGEYFCSPIPIPQDAAGWIRARQLAAFRRFSPVAAVANIANAGSMVSLDMMAQFSEDSHFLSYFDLSNLAKVILCVAMLLGRLEFFAVLALFNPALWRR